MISAVLTPGVAAASGGSATDWMYEGKHGLMLHYLAEGGPLDSQPGNDGAGSITVDQWNARVNAFDVERTAVQLKTMGVGWLILTIGQNSGFFNAPNATYDQIVGRSPSRLSTRNLPRDLGVALKKRGIKLIAYLPSNPPSYDNYAFGRIQPDDATFRTNWLNIVREWSDSFGTNVDGWWFDGAWSGSAWDTWNTNLAGAARSGNPASIIAFNNGVNGEWKTQVEAEQDYTSGETFDFSNAGNEVTGRFVTEGDISAQVAYLGTTQACDRCWGVPPESPLVYTDAQIKTITKRITDAQQVVTWDVGYVRETGAVSDKATCQQIAVGRDQGAPTETKIDDRDGSISYTGNWIDYDPGGFFSGTGHNANAQGLSAQVTVTGNSVTVYGVRGPDQGTFDVYLDGSSTPTATVNLYAESRTVNTPLYTATFDSCGSHTIRLVSAGNGWVTVDAVGIS